MANVELDVEVGIVDPQRVAGLQRRLGKFLAIARNQVQAAADVVEEVLERRRRTLESEDATDVHVGGWALLVEERGIDRSETVEMLLHAPKTTQVGPDRATAEPR